MKKFSTFINDKNAILENSSNDMEMIKFYCKDRLMKIYESGELNKKLQNVLQNCDDVELKVQSIVENYVQDYGHLSNNDILNGFDILSETIFENNDRFNKSFSELINTIVENPLQQHNINQKIQECYAINNLLLIEAMHNLGVKIGSQIDVQDNLSEQHINNAIVENYNFDSKPKKLLSICESLINSIRFITSFDKKSIGIDKLSSLCENLVNIYNIYHEGVELIDSQENNALEYFNLFIRGEKRMYDFQVQYLMKTLKNPATFCELGIMWIHRWVMENQNRLAYKFDGNQFIRLDNMLQIFKRQHPIIMDFDNNNKESSIYTFPKMFELMDILLNVSQMLRMDLRQLVLSYINLSRQMVISYRDDLQISRYH